MLESCSALMDIDHIISAIEQRIQITPEEMIVPPEIQVCWYAVEPGDIFLLLASLSGSLKEDYIPEVFSRSVLTLPMVVRYAEQVKLVIEFTPGSNLDFFHAYDSVHLDQLTLDAGSASGRLVLGKDIEPHHTIDETTTLINFITEL
ncbi:MAG TPA: hypothetical protein VMZ04_05070, partial [Anaerolineae bacterium]|nr:hypothetical protein [Anaerolineae bacterium]